MSQLRAWLFLMVLTKTTSFYTDSTPIVHLLLGLFGYYVCNMTFMTIGWVGGHHDDWVDNRKSQHLYGWEKSQLPTTKANGSMLHFATHLDTTRKPFLNKPSTKKIKILLIWFRYWCLQVGILKHASLELDGSCIYNI